MTLSKIIELEPQLAEIESGAEPSLRRLVEQYYAPHFENYKDFADDYFAKLEELILKGVED